MARSRVLLTELWNGNLRNPAAFLTRPLPGRRCLQNRRLWTKSLGYPRFEKVSRSTVRRAATRSRSRPGRTCTRPTHREGKQPNASETTTGRAAHIRVEAGSANSQAGADMRFQRRRHGHGRRMHWQLPITWHQRGFSRRTAHDGQRGGGFVLSQARVRLRSRGAASR